METRKPAFDLISINPAWLIGPFLHHVEVPSALGESLRECYCNFARKEDDLPPTIVQYWVDVRDAAKAHVLALEDSEANGRYLVVSRDKFDWKKVIRKIFSRQPSKRLAINIADVELHIGF
jgi:NADPH-dependent methylglyoxal reductase